MGSQERRRERIQRERPPRPAERREHETPIAAWSSRRFLRRTVAAGRLGLRPRGDAPLGVSLRGASRQLVVACAKNYEFAHISSNQRVAGSAEDSFSSSASPRSAWVTNFSSRSKETPFGKTLAHCRTLRRDVFTGSPRRHGVVALAPRQRDMRGISGCASECTSHERVEAFTGHLCLQRKSPMERGIDADDELAAERGVACLGKR